MKRKIVALLLLCCLSGATMAVPVLPRPFRVAQPDGTELTLYPYGDEYTYRFETADGYRVVNEDDAYFYASAGGERVLAHDPDRRGDAENIFLASLPKAAESLTRSSSADGVVTRSPIGAVTIHEGSPAIPVILVQFRDKRMMESAPKTSFTDRICRQAAPSEVEAGKGSAYQYFADQSQNKYTPEFVIIGPVTLDRDAAYYGADGAGGATDPNVGAMIADAITKAIAGGEVSDWSKFDNDGDGMVDAVYIIYAGDGQHSRPQETDLVWPHSSSLAERGVESPAVGSLKFNAYSCSNELLDGKPDGFGTFCHEFSHQLGLPDFYRTDGVTVTQFAMGSWSLMDYGSYEGGGFRPVGYRALEKQRMGWAEVRELTEAETVVGLKSTAAGASVLKVAKNANEYYLLEVIDGKGWDSPCKAQGLLITHVWGVGNDIWNNNTVNNSEPPHVFIIPADNDRTALISGKNEAEYEAGLAGDLYPSPDGNNELTDTSVPAADVQTGLSSKMGKPITAIAYDAATRTVSFDFMGGAPSAIFAPENEPSRPLRYYRLDGSETTLPPHGFFLYENSDGTKGKMIKP